jgi:capsular polysaccharide export protein
MTSRLTVGILSSGIWKTPYLSSFVDAELLQYSVFTPYKTSHLNAIAGWGKKPTATKAIKLASKLGLPYIAFEDGFLRSFNTGESSPPLSLVIDNQGIYYDSTCSSELETLLASSADVLQNIDADVQYAKSLILKNKISKYNHAPYWSEADKQANENHEKVLVIDQTTGDMSITLGAASAETFSQMLTAAYTENPKAIIYVKTHPEVSSGRKKGYLSQIQDDARTVVLRHAINPLSLIEQMDKVYVVTSTMGFEALLAGKPVSVFGLPWYAGWGATDDRQMCDRRTRKRTVDELFAAAYFHYARYIDPVTHQRGTIFDVIHWLIRQKEASAKHAGRMIAVGFRRWKAANIKPLLSLDQKKTLFVANTKSAINLKPTVGDYLIFWGREAPKGLSSLANNSSAKMLRVEDGFVRSVGLGSDLIRPLSLVLDSEGIYFDPAQSSGLERILNETQFSEVDLDRARHVRNFIIEHGITKYNIEPRTQATWVTYGKDVILVPGQVEDDASIRYGCTDVKTNLGLLKVARLENPTAFIVYKPHPDVMSGNRIGKLALAEAGKFADYIETNLSVVSCIDACDVVYTMTSLTGFDALLRGKQVVVFGQPFYAGWGLTKDVLKQGAAFSRRKRCLTLDELVAGTLLHYPIYWDWDLQGYASCEAVLQRIVETRTLLELNGGLEKLRLGYARRQWRKLGILFNTWVK